MLAYSIPYYASNYGTSLSPRKSTTLRLARARSGQVGNKKCALECWHTLLSPRKSIIELAWFHFSVRNGKRWGTRKLNTSIQERTLNFSLFGLSASGGNGNPPSLALWRARPSFVKTMEGEGGGSRLNKTPTQNNPMRFVS